MTKRWTVVIVVLAFVMVICFGCQAFRVKHITIEGLTRYTQEEFLERLEYNSLLRLTPVYSIWDSIVQKEIPFIEKYEIRYVDRNTVHITVHEKRVIGCVLLMGRYLYFDKDGIVVESSSEKEELIPVISGLEFNEITLYKKLNIQKESLFEQILSLARLIEKNEIAVEKIAFDSNYEVTLSVGEITILLGKKENYDESLNALRGILEVMNAASGTLDMRNYSSENPDVIFK